MRSRLDRPVAVCTATVSLVTAVALAAPTTARADDSLQPAPTQVAAITESVTDATAAALEAAPVEVTAPAESLPGLEPAPSESAAPPAEAPPEAAEAPPEPAEVLPAADVPATETAPEASADAASQDSSTADITATETDIAADTPRAAPEPARPQRPSASTVAPLPASVTANINVSVRIESPGDDGAVTQTNVALATPAPLAAAMEPLHAQTPAPTAPAATGAAPEPTAATDVDTWYWSWDCLGAPPISAISPSGSSVGSFPASWTWIWNCGDNSSQYHSETLPEYRQINTNIAIRFASPGNNGPVTQVNVGAEVTIPLPIGVRGAPLVPSPVLAPTAGEAAVEALPLLPETALSPVWASDTTDTSVALAPVVVAIGPQTTTVGQALAAKVAPAPRTAGDVGLGGWWRYGGALPSGATESTFRPSPMAEVPAAAGTTAAAPAGPGSAQPRRIARPPEASPRARPPLPDRAPVISTSGVSAAAAGGGGGSSGSGLPVLLALPFVAALLDLARRVALERATWPSGHRRRAPDTPG